MLIENKQQQKGNVMCFPTIGKEAKAKSFSGTFEEYQAMRNSQGNYTENVSEAVQRKDYEKAVAAGKETGVDASQAEQEKEIKEAKKTEAEKTADIKSEALEQKIATVTAPVSTMETEAAAKKRQKETTVNIESEAEVSPLETKAEVEPFETSLLSSKVQEQAKQFEGLSKRRSRSRGRRSLITGKSGGGIGYYSKFFT
tara:strand:+ start:2033 stop:2629 length:597 start_codon:yes stop_codon:yes gene_type:complete